MNVKGRTQFVPSWLCSLIIGPVLTEYSQSDNYFTNHKLQQLGFTYLYPTIDDGIPDIVQTWLKAKVASTTLP
jgi:NAD dependent epimerase/dehydratase family enzyme